MIVPRKIKAQVSKQKSVCVKDMVSLALTNRNFRGKINENLARLIVKNYMQEMYVGLVSGAKWEIGNEISFSIVRIDATGNKIIKTVSPMRNFYYRVLVEMNGKEPFIVKPGNDLHQRIALQLRNDKTFDYQYYEHKKESFN